MYISKIENPVIFRNNIKSHFNKKINNDTLSTNIEKSVYNYSIKEADRKKIIKKWDNKYFIQIYIDRFKSIDINLNDYIIEQLNNKQIKSSQIGFMTHQELFPKKWSKLIDAKIVRDKNKFNDNTEATTDTFTCRKCKSNKCSHYLMQTRSADEPTTIYVNCLNCGNRWKTC